MHFNDYSHSELFLLNYFFKFYFLIQINGYALYIFIIRLIYTTYNIVIGNEASSDEASQQLIEV